MFGIGGKPFKELSPQDQFNQFIKTGVIRQQPKYVGFGMWEDNETILWTPEEISKLLPQVDPNTIVTHLQGALTNDFTALKSLIHKNTLYDPDFTLALARNRLDIARIILQDDRTDPNLENPIRDLVEVIEQLPQSTLQEVAIRQNYLNLLQLLVSHPKTRPLTLWRALQVSGQKQVEDMILSVPHMREHAEVLEKISEIENDESALVDYFKSLVLAGHLFNEILVVDSEESDNHQFRFAIDFYNAIAREQKQLQSQNILASHLQQQLVDEHAPRPRKERKEPMLSRDIWNSIFFQRRQRELCRDLRSAERYPELFYLTLKLGLPIENENREEFSKGELCAQMAAFLTMADFQHPEKLDARMRKRVNILYKIAEELGVDVKSQNLEQISLEILNVLKWERGH
jgi:hypothetical protein